MIQETRTDQKTNDSNQMPQERKFIFLGQYGYYDLIAQCGIKLAKCPVYKRLFSMLNNGDEKPIRIDVTSDECDFPKNIKVKPTTGNSLKVENRTYTAGDGTQISQNRITAHLPNNVDIDETYDNMEYQCLMCILKPGNQK